jgi:hypothetical protein
LTETQLFTFVIAALNAGLASINVSGVIVMQDFQPTLQGAPSGSTINLHKIAEQRYGYLERSDVYANGVNTHTESQIMITTLQINAKVQIDPTNTTFDPTGMTSSDYVNLAVSILQSDFTRWTLRNNGIAVERITKSRVNHFVDEKGRYEADPSYDCNFEYNSVITSITPSTPTIAGTVKAVLVT